VFLLGAMGALYRIVAAQSQAHRPRDCDQCDVLDHRFLLYSLAFACTPEVGDNWLRPFMAFAISVCWSEPHLTPWDARVGCRASSIFCRRGRSPTSIVMLAL